MGARFYLEPGDRPIDALTGNGPGSASMTEPGPAPCTTAPLRRAGGVQSIELAGEANVHLNALPVDAATN